MRALFFATEAFQFQTGDRDARVGAVDLFRCAAQLVIERNGLLLARLLQLAQPLEFRFERGCLTLQGLLARDPLRQSLLLRFQLRGEFAHFALENQRSAGLLASAGQHSAVVALAVGEQEVAVGICVRHAARLVAVVRQIATREARQQIAGLAGESVREFDLVG